LTAATRQAFETLASAGPDDTHALAVGLRRNLAPQTLRAVAAAAVHVSAAAPERMAAIYDGLAAGWLDQDIAAAPAPSAPPPGAPLPISEGWWRTLWSIALPPAGAGRLRYGQQMMELAGELDLRINPRMAAAALDLPGVADAAGGEPPAAFDAEWLSQFSPASLGFALSQELLRAGSPAFDPYWASVLPYLRHMPAPLNYINVQVIQSMPLWSLVAGYSFQGLDRVAFGGFLMGQVGHHYSALASAVTLTTAAFRRPDNLELLLDCLFKGWAHGRSTPLLALAPWNTLWSARVDQAREALGVRPFASAYAQTPHEGWIPRII